MKKGKNKITIAIALSCIGLVMVIAVTLIGDVISYPRKQNTNAVEQIELELTYAYQNPQWNAAMENTIRNFEKEYPNINIHYDLSYEEKVYENVLNRKIARNELGDIVQLKTPKAYAAAGLLGPVSAEVASRVSSNFEYDGNVYGLGAIESTWGVIYNKDLFDLYGLKEPENYEDFLNLCRVLKSKGITPIGVGGKDLWHMEYWTNHFFRADVLSGDEDWLKKCEQGLVSWTDEAPRAMMNHFYELFHDGYVNANWITTADTSLAYKMSQGEVAMIYSGPWTAAAIQTLNPEMEMGWFYVPDEDGVIYAADNYDTFWGVTRECAADEKKYEAAMLFLSYFYEESVYAPLCESTCNFPLTVEAIDYELTPMQEEVTAAFQEADHQIPVYIGNEDTPERFERIMLELVRDILSGECAVEDGLQRIQNSWESCSGQGGAS